MRPAVSLKTLYRSPGKTIITFLLLAALTFSLLVQVAEYASTAREFAENVDMYVGTGFLEKREAALTGYNALQFPYYIATDPRVAGADTGLPDFSDYDYPALTAAEVETLSALPGVSSASKRYMTAGRSAYSRLLDDAKLWDSNSLAIVEGTLMEPCMRISSTHGVSYTDSEWFVPAYRLSEPKLLAGDLAIDWYQDAGWKAWYGFYDTHRVLAPEQMEKMPKGLMEEGELYFFPCPLPDEEGHSFAYYCADDEESWEPIADKKAGNMYDFDSNAWAVGNVILDNYSYGFSGQREWTVGDRYVFVFRFTHEKNPDTNFAVLSLNLYDWLSEHFCPAVWNVTDASEDYLDLPEYAPLRQLMEIIESDHNTQDVVYVDDMSAIRQIRDEKMVLTEGRWLTPEDTAQGNMVCVLDQKFAWQYGLKVGDTLSLELGDELFEQFYNLGAVASTVERYAENWTPAEFEIVGLYQGVNSFAATKEPNWSYSVNTVFVPLSALPATVDLSDHEFAPGEFTFRVDNAWDIANFLEEGEPQIEAMGLTLMFDDGGWMEVYTPYMTAQRAALVRIGVLAAVTVLATAFVVYLFISRKRKDYAIMRALGTPKSKSGASLLLPLMVLAAASVAVGLVAAMAYVRRSMAAPLWLALLCGSAELVLALLLALLMLHGLSRKSPLALLQGEQTKHRKIPVTTGVGRDDLGTPPDIPIDAPRPDEIETPYRTARRVVAPYKKSIYHPRPVRFTLRYIARHIRRSAVKSLLSVLVAALMLATVGQLSHLRRVYRQLRTDTVVTAYFNKSIILPKLKDLEAEGFTADLYYERNLEGVIVLEYAYTPEIRIALTNDIAHYVGGPCQITYADGHGPEDMGVIGKYVVLGKALMEQCGASPGDTVRLCKLVETDNFIQTESRRLQKEFPGQYPDTRDSLWKVWPDYIERELDKLCDCLTVIGVVETGNATYDGMAFSPGMETTKKFMNDNILEYVEFRVPDNARAAEMKQRGEEMTGHRKGAFSIDIEKLESVERTAHLLETLYPIVVVLTLIIGAFLCALIILQTAKDAAIMRIQGTTAAMTRAILVVEQVLLAVLGVVIGVGVMAALKGHDFPLIAARTLTFGGAYIVVAAVASTVSAVLATRKNLLELLQTKE